MEATLNFISLFYKNLIEIAPLPLMFVFWIVLLGLIVGRIENWRRFDSVYWAFITAFTVGYGDIRPVKPASRVLAIFIALFGLMLTGIIVALTVTVATQVFAHVPLK